MLCKHPIRCNTKWSTLPAGMPSSMDIATLNTAALDIYSATTMVPDDKIPVHAWGNAQSWYIARHTTPPPCAMITTYRAIECVKMLHMDSTVR